jgi:polyvinyl alcohol dehydrogenase (cytochrome)
VAIVGALALGVAATDDGATASATAPARRAAPARCDWPMWGYSIGRPFATKCPSTVNATTAADLRLRWFTSTHDVVTATPALSHGSLYVGDWSGRIVALSAKTGKIRWTFRAPIHPQVYSGQVVASAAVAEVRGVRTVFVPSGNTMFALRAKDGHLRWSYRIGPRTEKNTSEIESSPVVVDGRVVFGWDVHNEPSGRPAGVVALDARTGRVRWRHVTAPVKTGPNATGAGCGDVWGSPAVDRGRRLVIFGTGNCVVPDGWGPASDALIALDLDDGSVRWTYQPHPPNRDDLDFAGAPNLFEVDGRALVGLGNKDGNYYIVDRESGAPVAVVDATAPGLSRPGGNFSTGGFIGPAAYSDGMVVGGTAVGPAPYLHGIDVRTGQVAWQNREPAATYAATAVVGDIAFVGGTDFTLRAVRVSDGTIVWSHPMKGAVSGGAIVDRDRVYAVAGIREPGIGSRSRTSGVYAFALRGKAFKIRLPRRPTTTTTAAATAPADQECVGTPCSLSFTLRQPPAGLTPTATLEVTESPFRLEVATTGLGDPAQWVRPGSAAARTGATRFGAFMSESDDNPTGGLVCILGADGGCTGTRIPRKGATYNRVTIVAIKGDTMPSLADGFDRLVTTQSFDPKLAPRR